MCERKDVWELYGKSVEIDEMCRLKGEEKLTGK